MDYRYDFIYFYNLIIIILYKLDRDTYINIKYIILIFRHGKTSEKLRIAWLSSCQDNPEPAYIRLMSSFSSFKAYLLNFKLPVKSGKLFIIKLHIQKRASHAC